MNKLWNANLSSGRALFDLVDRYSQCDLTFARDKLVAHSDIISALRHSILAAEIVGPECGNTIYRCRWLNMRSRGQTDVAYSTGRLCVLAVGMFELSGKYAMLLGAYGFSPGTLENQAKSAGKPNKHIGCAPRMRDLYS